jgi:hypothetical protein
MRKCPKCGYVQPVRSLEMNDRFHGWVTWITQQLHGQHEREYVYWMCLLKACEIEPPEGADEYPYVMVEDFMEINGTPFKIDRLQPFSTSERTNKEMMTACAGIEAWVWEKHREILPLPERSKW